MEAKRKKMRIVLNLEILEARNVTVKSEGSRNSLFVRYYPSTGSSKGNSNISVSTREVKATPAPQWRQNFCLESGLSIGYVNLISELQKESLRFEMWERSNRIRVLGNMFKESKLVGWMEIPWKNLLASPSLSIKSWFPLMPTIAGESKLQPSLHLAFSLNPFNLTHTVSQPHQEHRTEIEIHNPEAVSCRNATRRRVENVNKRIGCLQGDSCRCGGKSCCQEIHAEDDSCFYIRPF